MKNPRRISRCFGIELVRRGHAKRHPNHNREFGVFVVAVAEFYSFRKSWHQDDRVTPLIRQYQATVESVVRDCPGLASCAVACCDCGIRFLTHPRNAKRYDLRCPFGCRQHHRRERGNARSRKYGQSTEGARKKKLRNGRRTKMDHEAKSAVSGLSPSVDVSPETSPVGLDRPREDVQLALDGYSLRESIVVKTHTLSYLVMLLRVLEDIVIAPTDLLDQLRQRMRQRSIGSLSRREYVLRYLHEHPPPGVSHESTGGTNES